MASIPTTIETDTRPNPARPTCPSGDEDLVISYLTLRKAVGVIGIAFPWVLSLGCLAVSGIGLEASISDYYGTVMRDVFVGLLFAVGLFLFSYKGYAKGDDRAGKLGCSFAVGIALFPTTSPTPWVRHAHLAFAAALFLTLSYFSLCLFTKTDPTRTPTQEKTRRNVVYKVSGVVILASIGLAAVCMVTPIGAALAPFKPVFWLESIALESFGLSWITKGEAILGDKS